MPSFPFGHISYLGIVLLLALTGLGLPVPEEVPVVLSGWASANGQMNPWLAFFACLVGALIGDCLVYAIGYHFGHNLLRDHRLLARFLHAEREQRVEEMIQQHGLKVFFLGRILVGLRSTVFLAAGVLRIPFRRFILMDAFSASVIIGVVFALSYRYARQIEQLFGWIRRAELTMTILVVVAAIGCILLYRRYRLRRRDQLHALRRNRAARRQALPQDTTLSS